MKNLKFIVAVAVITFATFSSFNANARKAPAGETRCVDGAGYCGVSVNGCALPGISVPI